MQHLLHIFFLTSKLCNRLIPCEVFAGTVNVWFFFSYLQMTKKNSVNGFNKKKKLQMHSMLFHYFHNSTVIRTGKW